MLGGGAHPGQLTEISGLPGTGKTQIAYVDVVVCGVTEGCLKGPSLLSPVLTHSSFLFVSCPAVPCRVDNRMQLAIDARIPRGFKGAGQQAVYIGKWVGIHLIDGLIDWTTRSACLPKLSHSYFAHDTRHGGRLHGRARGGDGGGAHRPPAPHRQGPSCRPTLFREGIVSCTCMHACMHDGGGAGPSVESCVACMWASPFGVWERYRGVRPDLKHTHTHEHTQGGKATPEQQQEVEVRFCHHVSPSTPSQQKASIHPQFNARTIHTQRKYQKPTHPSCPFTIHCTTHTQALTLEAILAGVHVFRCLDDKELLTTLEHLPGFLDAHPEVKQWALPCLFWLCALVLS